MIAQAAYCRLNVPPNAGPKLRVVEKRDMLRPRYAHHDTQPVLRRFVEELA